MKETFNKDLRLHGKNRIKINTINNIIEEYITKGYVLTLRQLYYQLVSRDIIPNKQTEYAKISTLLAKGRMSGFIDWAAIEDRTRIPDCAYYENSVEGSIDRTINNYKLDRHQEQKNYLEVWIEKDALSGIVKRSTRPFTINLMVNRGYSSVSAMYEAYNRIANELNCGKEQAIIFYLGDHDPSGLDMIRDVRERLVEMLSQGEAISDLEGLDEDNRRNYISEKLIVKPIALTEAQIRLYNPPPNPAKFEDPRAEWYMKKYGNMSWEVDALKPEVLSEVIEKNILEYIDMDIHNEILAKETKDINLLKRFREKL